MVVVVVVVVVCVCVCVCARVCACWLALNRHTTITPPRHGTGEGRVHACLRAQWRHLSEGCRREEALLEQQEAETIELRPNLLKACADERAHFCMNVQAGAGRVFRCVCVCVWLWLGMGGWGRRGCCGWRTSAATCTHRQLQPAQPVVDKPTQHAPTTHTHTHQVPG
jgi:hypothetical protein